MRRNMAAKEKIPLTLSDEDDDINKVDSKLLTKVRFQINGSHVLDDLSFSLYYHCKKSTQIAHSITIPFGYFALTCMLSILSLLITNFHVFEILPAIIWALPLTVWYFYLFRLLGILWGILLFGQVVSAKYFLSWLYPLIFHTSYYHVSSWIILFCVNTIITAVLLMMLPAHHKAFEKASPARSKECRPYEAFVTTPLLLSWILVNKLFNYRRDELSIVFQRSIKWDNSPYARNGFVIPKL